MAFKILAELALLVITFVAGGAWWQLLKRGKLLRKIVRDEALLNRTISKAFLTNPPSQIQPYLRKNEIGYVLNIDVVLKADQSSQRIPKIAATVVTVLVFICSYFVASTFLWINVGVFLLMGLMPITDSASHNASEQVLTLAAILHKWRAEDAAECDAFVTQAHSLQRLYEAVKQAS
jgi:hypothetical protein